jgi:hypothetical protein
LEGPSNDPYLGGAIAAATVQGTQEQGVIASVKVCRYLHQQSLELNIDEFSL